ncbi:PhzF family phenazine biosynthesis protein [Frondihabitans cladoniiphilus]|uniref:PhzF family phenazine biosynthesis isomerase n=1 Tax=Frondihabitans cladoniiphilus TaxID=715785 RepID=A0ABP8VNQ6_9MICO
MTEILRLAAFASSPTGGNPAGVVLDATGLSDAEMQRIAAEVDYPETAFLIDPRVDGDERHVRIRYFSPDAEVPFCGHATIATSVVLAQGRGVGPFTLETNVGPIGVSTVLSDDGSVMASFTSVEPAVRPLASDVAARLLDLLGLSRDDLDGRYPLSEAFAGNWHPIVAVRDAALFDSFSYDGAAVHELMLASGWTGTVSVVHVGAAGSPVAASGVSASAASTPGASVSSVPASAAALVVVEARNIFPVGTITEDPATGSAAAAFGGYLRALGLVTPPARVEIHQGRHVGRPSLLVVDVPAVGGITVSGSARPIV